ncbi:MAG: hypothetical protein IT348_19745 [Candidatus Eisenbacteria bacterium]|nr:hypothetical protein [Candidatus Eisenbacteria bacterium]
MVARPNELLVKRMPMAKCWHDCRVTRKVTTRIKVCEDASEGVNEPLAAAVDQLVLLERIIRIANRARFLLMRRAISARGLRRVHADIVRPQPQDRAGGPRLRSGVPSHVNAKCAGQHTVELSNRVCCQLEVDSTRASDGVLGSPQVICQVIANFSNSPQKPLKVLVGHEYLGWLARERVARKLTALR